MEGGLFADISAMPAAICEFVSQGSARDVSRAIEAQADEQRVLTVLVVPWESEPARVNMAVTSVKADGWAIEHTNLGTITLANLEGNRTRVSVVALDVEHEDRARLLGLFERFANRLRDQFQIKESTSE